MAEGGTKANAKVNSDEERVKDDSTSEVETIETENVSTSQWLAGVFKKGLNLDKEAPKEKVIPSLDLEGVAEHIKSGKCKNIITMAGAGISTSAGIPDFRTPGSGLYDNLQKYDLPHPQAIFQLDFFKENPEPFFELAKNLWPGIFKPTACHYFLKLLEEKGLMLRHYSQNIDTLEYVAGMTDEKLVLAHGSFHSAHCLTCCHEYSQECVKEQIFSDSIPTCKQDGCEGIIKPDIVFFGEQMPSRFFKSVNEDLGKCDLLIIMGTSLVVQPFASLPSKVSEDCPRLYINLENTSVKVDPLMAMFGMGQNFLFDQENNYRDVFYQGTCDDGCQKLADLIGWGDELRSKIKTEHVKIEKEIASNKSEIKDIKDKKSKKGVKTETDIF